MNTNRRFILAAIIGLAAGVLSAQDRIELGAPKTASRLGVMRSAADRIRALIRPDAGWAGMAALAAAAAGYGVLHALGPGHQKTLLSGYVLSEGGGFGRIAAAAGIAAASHAASVTALFGGLAALGGAVGAADAESAGRVVGRISGIALLGLALWRLKRRLDAARERLGRRRPAAGLRGKDGHEHGAACACGSCAAHDRTAGRGGPALLVLGSLVPCPGAAFFLLLGFSAGNPAAGALAVAAISAGMWATLVAVGCAAGALRGVGLARAGGRGSRAEAIARTTFEVGGAAAVVLFAALLIV